MNWSDILNASWKSNPVVSEERLDSLRGYMPFPLPSEYLEFLRWSDGGEGALGTVYLNVWSSAEAVRLNLGYKIRDYLPNVWVVGDDSAHFYGYEQTADKTVEAIRFPMGFMHPSAIDAHLPCIKTMFAQLATGKLF